jgi:hypothetical protein
MSKTIKKGLKKKVTPLKRGYDMFRCEYFKRLKNKDPVKYNQISKNIGSYN